MHKLSSMGHSKKFIIAGKLTKNLCPAQVLSCPEVALTLALSSDMINFLRCNERCSDDSVQCSGSSSLNYHQIVMK